MANIRLASAKLLHAVTEMLEQAATVALSLKRETPLIIALPRVVLPEVRIKKKSQR